MSDQVEKEEIKSTTRAVKRCSSENIAPPLKSPRTDIPSPEADGRPEKDQQDLQSENTVECSSPTARRKSWRRATLSRRSLPALPNPYQVLCRSISTSLSPQERLEKLMEASMRLAIDRTQNSLKTATNSSLDSFQIKVEHMQKEWDCLAKSICSESHGPQPNGNAASLGEASAQSAMEKIKTTIKRLEAESESWETMLKKHKDKAEQLQRKVQMGHENGITPDSTSLSLSSQHQVILSKPNYNTVLSKQQPMLQTMALIMDTQCKMVKNLLSIKDQSQLVVKETSGQLATASGLHDLTWSRTQSRDL